MNGNDGPVRHLAEFHRSQASRKEKRQCASSSETVREFALDSEVMTTVAEDASPKGEADSCLRGSPASTHAVRGEAYGAKKADAYGNKEEEEGASCVSLAGTRKLRRANERLREEIARREAAEAALIENQRRLDMALSGAELGLWDWNLRTGEMVFNDRWAEMLGFSLEEIEPLFQAEDMLIHPDERDMHKQAMDSHLDGTTRFFEFEHRLKCKSGSWRWVLDRGKVVERDEKGRPLRVAGIHVDITDLKRAQEELQDSRELFVSFMDFLPGGGLIFKGTGEIIYVNEFLRECFHADQWIGRSVYECAPELIDEGLDRTVSDTCGKTPVMKTISLSDRDGVERFFHTTTFPIARPSKDPLYGVLCVDVSEQRNLEEQLRRANKMQAVGTLAGGIAHDFNNLLFAISGFTELALDQALVGSLMQSHLLNVQQASARAKCLVNQVLTLSRQSKPVRKSVDVTPIVHEVGEFLRATIPATTRIEITSERNLEPILGDPTQIHQVLMNLCTNAAQAIGLEGGVVAIRLCRGFMDEAEPSDTTKKASIPCLSLSVVDTGPGMTNTTVERVFDPYFTTKVPGEGTGLGLAVVHGIVKSHGGRISVESEVGKGSAFTIRIPLSRKRATENLRRLMAICRGFQGQSEFSSWTMNLRSWNCAAQCSPVSALLSMPEEVVRKPCSFFVNSRINSTWWLPTCPCRT